MKLLDRAFYAVRWADAHSSGSVTEYAEHELPHRSAHYTTYGFLLRQDETGLTLATEHSDEHTYRGVCFIPAAMVVECVPLTLTKKRAPKAIPEPVDHFRTDGAVPEGTAH
jgi:hypothetical protein